MAVPKWLRWLIAEAPESDPPSRLDQMDRAYRTPTPDGNRPVRPDGSPDAIDDANRTAMERLVTRLERALIEADRAAEFMDSRDPAPNRTHEWPDVPHVRAEADPTPAEVLKAALGEPGRQREHDPRPGFCCTDPDCTTNTRR